MRQTLCLPDAEVEVEVDERDCTAAVKGDQPVIERPLLAKQHKPGTCRLWTYRNRSVRSTDVSGNATGYTTPGIAVTLWSQ